MPLPLPLLTRAVQNRDREGAAHYLGRFCWIDYHRALPGTHQVEHTDFFAPESKGRIGVDHLLHEIKQAAINVRIEDHWMDVIFTASRGLIA